MRREENITPLRIQADPTYSLVMLETSNDSPAPRGEHVVARLQKTERAGTSGQLFTPISVEDGFLSDLDFVVKCATHTKSWLPYFNDSDLIDLYMRAKELSHDDTWGIFYREFLTMIKVGGKYAPSAYAFGCVIEDGGLRGRRVSPAVIMERLPSSEGWKSLEEACILSSIEHSTRSAANVGIMLARAVGAFRDCGILHHDISSNNVFVQLENNRGIARDLRLIDFGQSAKISGTETHFRYGTPAYAAPEMIPHFNTATLSDDLKKHLNRTKNGYASDIWPIGAALYHVRTGTSPLAPNTAESDDENERYAQIITAKLRGLSLPKEACCTESDCRLSSLIEQCTSCWPLRRPTPESIESKLRGILNYLDRGEQARTANQSTGKAKMHKIGSRNNAASFPNDTTLLNPLGESSEGGLLDGDQALSRVYGALYRLDKCQGNMRHEILVLGASKEGCSANGVTVNGCRYLLELVDGPTLIPEEGWREEDCPWVGIEAAYVRGPIRPSRMVGWFSGCSRLITVRGLDEIDLSNATSIATLFSGCKSLDNLDLSSWNTSSVTDMSALFSGCESLEKLNLSGWVVSSVRARADMFTGCSETIAQNEAALFSTDVASNVSEDAEAIENLYPEEIENITFPEYEEGDWENKGEVPNALSQPEAVQTILIKKPDGSEAAAEVLLCFSSEQYGHNYILYSFGEMDDNDNVTIHAAVLSEGEDRYVLDRVPDDEWEFVKDVMRQIIENEE